MCWCLPKRGSRPDARLAEAPHGQSAPRRLLSPSRWVPTCTSPGPEQPERLPPPDTAATRVRHDAIVCMPVAASWSTALQEEQEREGCTSGSRLLPPSCSWWQPELLSCILSPRQQPLSTLGWEPMGDVCEQGNQNLSCVYLLCYQEHQANPKWRRSWKHKVSGQVMSSSSWKDTPASLFFALCYHLI